MTATATGNTWFPWDAKAFMDAELSLEASGAFARILSRSWERHGWLPDSDEVLARVVGVPLARFRDKIRPAIVHLFEVVNGCWEHPWLRTAWENMARKSASCAERGKRGGQAKALNGKGQGLATANQVARQTLDSRQDSFPVPSEQGARGAPPAEWVGFPEGLTTQPPPPADPPAAPSAAVPSATVHELFPDQQQAPPPAGSRPALEVATELAVVAELERQGVPASERWGLFNGWRKALREQGGLDPGTALATVLALVLSARDAAPGEFKSWVCGLVRQQIGQLQGLEDRARRRRRGYGGDV